MTTHSAEETEKLGQDFAKKIKKGGILALYGELGSGKTTFVKGLARGLGIKRRIISPTYIFIREYPMVTCNTEQATGNFYHLDLYRVKGIKDTRALGIEEILSNPQNIVAIEWAEKIKNILPKNRIDIYFKYLGKNKREIMTSRQQ